MVSKFPINSDISCSISPEIAHSRKEFSTVPLDLRKYRKTDVVQKKTIPDVFSLLDSDD